MALSKDLRILDCTLRDGGYYTQWDFNNELVNSYVKACNELPVDYIEIGYRSLPRSGYYGEYYYCAPYVMEKLKLISTKKLVILIDEKDVTTTSIIDLLVPCKQYIELVRIATDPKNFSRAIGLAAVVKSLGFDVAFNVMYMSTWKSESKFIELLPEVKGIADYFYMVDSYGGIYPSEVRESIDIVKSKMDVKIGFHGHNNLELALINTLTAIDCGVDIVDVTVTGMGRGAGNLKTELLLTALAARQQISEFSFNALVKVVDLFTSLQEDYKWGTNLPYMVSGANSLPQNEVMNWVGKRYYSFNSIIRALDNRTKGLKDNQRLPLLKAPKVDISNLLIIGGGPSVMKNEDALRQFLEKNPQLIVIHASSKYAKMFSNISNIQVFCMVGNEGHRMEEVFSGNLPNQAICVLPPYPRWMGTYIPEALANSACELKESIFGEYSKDSHTAIALQTAINFGINKVYLVGYDGYSTISQGGKEQYLFGENESIFSLAASKGMRLTSLTPTSYKTLVQESIHSMV